MEKLEDQLSKDVARNVSRPGKDVARNVSHSIHVKPDKYQNKYRISSARTSWWDYDKNGVYFVTICTAGRVHYFGEIAPESPVETLHATSLQTTSEISKQARQYWVEIPSHFPFVALDEFVIMPNHVHGIIMIDRDSCAIVETLHATSLPEQPKNQKMADLSPKTGTLSSVIRSFKSAVTNWCNKNEYAFGWQSRFHDHIIRTDAELDRIREYIINNPVNWNDDKFFNNCQ